MHAFNCLTGKVDIDIFRLGFSIGHCTPNIFSQLLKGKTLTTNLPNIVCNSSQHGRWICAELQIVFPSCGAKIQFAALALYLKKSEPMFSRLLSPDTQHPYNP